MNLFDYRSSKRIKLIDTNNEEWTGTVEDIIPSEDNDDGTDSIVIRSESSKKYRGKLVEFSNHEIKSIEIV